MLTATTDQSGRMRRLILSLRWSHKSNCRFCRAQAHIFSEIIYLSAFLTSPLVKQTQEKIFKPKRLSTGANFVHVYIEIQKKYGTMVY